MRNQAFVRKITYVVIAALLLIPLSLISQPSTQIAGASGDQLKSRSEGGVLAQLRDEYDLSQAKLMEIDPASETMKLASVGLRGVAVNLLWMQAMEHRKKKNWDKLRSTLSALIKIQPNFIKVWEYQAHNLSYNISVEFDDYEYRYHWVKEGISFLTDGIPYNYRNHRITDNLGFFTGMKIGRSDERFQFRELFRKDTDFHEAMMLKDGKGVDPDRYDTREYGHDNWKMAWLWYDKSRDLVAKYPRNQYINDMMFYRKRPMQLMNQARSLQDEFLTDDIIQEIWRDGNREWNEYGEREIRTTSGLPVTFKGLADFEARLADARRELDELVPGYRDGYMQEVIDAANLTERQKQALEIPQDERSEEDEIIADAAEEIVQMRSRGIDSRIAQNAAPKDFAAAKRLVDKIDNLMNQMNYGESYADTVNYRYWNIRSEAEARDVMAEARRSMRRAEEMKRNSIFDDEYQYDAKTGEKKLIKRGAISLFEESFKKWKTALDDPNIQTAELVDGEVIDDLIEACGEYYDMLRITGREWPVDFVFQDYVDARAAYAEDDLPTSQDVADRVSGLTDTTDDKPNENNESTDQDSGDSPSDNDSQPDDSQPDDGSPSDNGSQEDEDSDSSDDEDKSS